jgi:hypothetical protein
MTFDWCISGGNHSHWVGKGVCSLKEIPAHYHILENYLDVIHTYIQNEKLANS